jgi:pyruvate dehydrogenase E1 component
MYRFSATTEGGTRPKVRLLGSGAILRESIAALQMLAAEWQIAGEVWSVTSFAELAREARETERWNRLHPTAPSRASFVSSCLEGDAPIVAATDYLSAYANLVAGFIGAPFVSLGTDGFGRSDNRASLRRFFEVDRQHIVVAALQALVKKGELSPLVVDEAIKKYELNAELAPPWTL